MIDTVDYKEILLISSNPLIGKHNWGLAEEELHHSDIQLCKGIQRHVLLQAAVSGAALIHVR